MEQDRFLALFPHRFDYIWAEHSEGSTSVQWQTERRHRLSDRLIQQGSYLYGVRFGAETCYCLLDIDCNSLYHPRHDPLAVSRIAAALEPVGLVRYVACTSSYSGGLHLYFPFEQAQSSWRLAIAVSALLEKAGFKLKPGHLEVFPDPKPYNVDGKPSLFNAHRLPLQTGSYLLNQDFQPIWSSQDTFVAHWMLAQKQNEVDASSIRSVLKQVKRRRYAVSTKAEKFINDLNAEIELGWTGFGQTNYLLGRITMREYIFRHVLTGGQPLKGESLVSAIVEIAQSLPGYYDYCRHRHEIVQRAQEWAQCIENSHYFPYGDAAGKFKAKLDNAALGDGELESCIRLEAIAQAPNWNQQQAEGARDRIKRAISELLEKGTLPVNATARFRVLVSYGIGGGTLYNHRDLWHPHYLTVPPALDFPGSDLTGLDLTGLDLTAVLESSIESSPAMKVKSVEMQSVEMQSVEMQSVENPPHPPTLSGNREGDCFWEASPSHCSPSLFPVAGRNPLLDEHSGDCLSSGTGTGRNFSVRHMPAKGGFMPCQTARDVQQVLWEIKAAQTAQQAALQRAYEQQEQIKRQAAVTRHIARMQQFLESGDPILVAEAIAWTRINPGVLNETNGSVTTAFNRTFNRVLEQQSSNGGSTSGQ